jgi:hypothetical protein
MVIQPGSGRESVGDSRSVMTDRSVGRRRGIARPPGDQSGGRQVGAQTADEGPVAAPPANEELHIDCELPWVGDRATLACAEGRRWRCGASVENRGRSRKRRRGRETLRCWSRMCGLAAGSPAIHPERLLHRLRLHLDARPELDAPTHLGPGSGRVRLEVCRLCGDFGRHARHDSQPDGWAERTILLHRDRREHGCPGRRDLRHGGRGASRGPDARRRDRLGLHTAEAPSIDSRRPREPRTDSDQPGGTRSGARSDSGARTKRRRPASGCGTSSSRVALAGSGERPGSGRSTDIRSSPKISRSRSSSRGP